MTDPHDQDTPQDSEDEFEPGEDYESDEAIAEAAYRRALDEPEPEALDEQTEAVDERPERVRVLPAAPVPDGPAPPAGPVADPVDRFVVLARIVERLGPDFESFNVSTINAYRASNHGLQQILITQEGFSRFARNVYCPKPFEALRKEIVWALFCAPPLANAIYLGSTRILVERDHALVRRRLEESSNAHRKDREPTLDEHVRVPDLLIVHLGWSRRPNTAEVIYDVLAARDGVRKPTWLLGADIDRLPGETEFLRAMLTRLLFDVVS